MSFEVADMKQALEAVEAAGGKLVLGPVEPRPGRQVAQIIDPDGNLIEIGHDG